MAQNINNIFENLPDSNKEVFEILLQNKKLKLERIISRGQATPEGQWYNQDKDEWIILLSGSAKLLFEGSEEIIELKPGDYLNIPAHKKHRVEWTAQDTETVWIALHYSNI
ncbi:MAG: cupin domain-containing protein [bacterium]